MDRDLINNNSNFDVVINIIENAKNRAFRAVNKELISMYWDIGKYLSELCSESDFGDKVIEEVAAYISSKAPSLKGFSRRGLYRMKQFYEIYKDDEFVSSMLTQISWTNHLLIMSKAKTKEERDFYILLAVNERLSSRELERQLNSAYYERYMLSTKKDISNKVSIDIRENFLDTYVLEFLDLPKKYSENNLRKAIIDNLKDFILELGKGFTFIGEEYRVQVGNEDYYID